MRLHNPACLVFSGLCNRDKDRYLLDEKAARELKNIQLTFKIRKTSCANGFDGALLDFDCVFFFGKFLSLHDTPSISRAVFKLFIVLKDP